VEKKGEWHPAGYWTPLVVQDGILYVASGWNTTVVNSIAISTLARLIRCPAVRLAFQQWLGLPFSVSKK